MLFATSNSDASVVFKAESRLLPCEWCQQSADAWCHRGSGTADTTSSRGPGPCGSPDTGWHPSAPSQGNYTPGNGKEEWHSTMKEGDTFEQHNLLKKERCLNISA